jgi:hypothetical protein
MIEHLKNNLELMSKENDVFRRFTKVKSTNIGGDLLQKMIEKSGQEIVDLKNIQLKKFERIEEKKEEQKHERAVVMEKQANVSDLKNIFEPGYKEKQMKK